MLDFETIDSKRYKKEMIKYILNNHEILSLDRKKLRDQEYFLISKILTKKYNAMSVEKITHLYFYYLRGF